MGLHVAKQLAQKGASILIVARNVGKLEEALGQIKVSLPKQTPDRPDHPGISIFLFPTVPIHQR
jgi:NAD(P)-dependent dehydrogenase (short-subunit alcohol dehydrogenase family)